MTVDAGGAGSAGGASGTGLNATGADVDAEGGIEVSGRLGAGKTVLGVALAALAVGVTLQTEVALGVE